MSRIWRALITAAIVITFPLEAATAESVPPVWVVPPAYDAGLTRCGLNTSSATAAAESALRFNRVSTATKDDWMADRAIEFGIDLNAFEITRVSGSSTGSCAVNLQVFLGTATYVFDPVNKNKKFSTIHFCDKGTLMTFDPLSTQDAVNKQIADYVNRCISEYAAMKVY